MKFIFIKIFVVCIFLSGIAKAQWNLRFPSWHKINDIHSFGNDTVYAGIHEPGHGAYFIRSFDGGAVFDSVSFTEMNYIKIHFLSDKIGFLVGEKTLPSTYSGYKTQDGGNTWEPMNTSAIGQLTSINIHFLNIDTGFVGIGGKLYKTIDGGAWFDEIELLQGNYHSISDIDFIDQQTGFVSVLKYSSPGDVAIRHFIFKTNDAGVNWQLVFNEIQSDITGPNIQGITSMQFVNAQIGYATSSSVPSKLYKSIDGGSNWDTLSTSFVRLNEMIADVYFTSEQIGYVISGNRILKTVDGGLAWQQQDVFNGTDMYYESIKMVNDSLGYFCGYGLYKTQNGGGASSLKPNTKQNLGIEIFPNPTRSELNIKVPNDVAISSVKVIDASGRIVMLVPNSASKLDLRGFAKGNYWLLLQTNKGMSSLPFVIK